MEINKKWIWLDELFSEIDEYNENKNPFSISFSMKDGNITCFNIKHHCNPYVILSYCVDIDITNKERLQLANLKATLNISSNATDLATDNNLDEAFVGELLSYVVGHLSEKKSQIELNIHEQMQLLTATYLRMVVYSNADKIYLLKKLV